MFALEAPMLASPVPRTIVPREIASLRLQLPFVPILIIAGMLAR
jgi:hypothetical protein